MSGVARVFSLVLLGLVVMVGAARANDTAPTGAGYAPQGDVRLVRVGTRGYAVPAALIFGPVDNGLVQDEILIAGLLPGLTPRPSEPAADAAIDRRLLQVTLSSDPQGSLAQALRGAIALQGEPLHRGAMFGLQVFGFETTAEGVLPQEVFVDGPVERPRSYLLCRPADWTDAGCTQWFDRDGLRVHLSWPRARLADWRMIGRTVIDRLDGFAKDFARLAAATR
ncbi:hypothetical protein [Marinivivus vitaminiproducens]|uniref:hypothetical protein n=1 Tax=Marinivivus vitaminiproducens TaxID=3035935 RepID=UPI00279B929B|nr:hypothetical protein P4R82_19490 [Geminicoccaceae bacterium SCSIO 64248]